MKNSSDINTTVVTAGDRAYSWGAYLLTASMRMNGMQHPNPTIARNCEIPMNTRFFFQFTASLGVSSIFSDFSCFSVKP